MKAPKRKLLTAVSVIFFLIGTIMVSKTGYAECVIKKGDKVVFSCEGNEGTCDAKKFGYTLTCSGKLVGQTDESQGVGL